VTTPDDDEPEEAAPLTAQELAALPVFPLPRVVLLPGAQLPLHLFEPRYRDMMRDCVERGPMAFAVAMFEPGWESDYEGCPAIRPIAGAGRITDFRQRNDGRWDLMLVGVGRVRLTELPEDGRSYRRASAEPIEDRVSHPKVVQRMRPQVLATAASVASVVREEHPEFELGLGEGLSAGELADRLADRLVPDAEMRQHLLETADVKVRLHMVHDAMVELLAQLRARGMGGALH